MHGVRIFRGSSLQSAQQGFALIEVLIAALVIAIGILGLVGAFDSARKLSLLSERRSSMGHRAQLELERLQTYPYSELAMTSAPSHSNETNNPDYYVNYSSPVKCTSAGDGCYAWNAESTGEEEALVPASKGECTTTPEAGCGVAGSSPTGRGCSSKVGACEWSDGQLEGKVYDFVTWHTDGRCGVACPSKENYKRLTVVVTDKVPSGNHEPAQVRVSTLVTEAS
jgi:prepilin-type N-terminal cleavage/methylation domain-containing protein